MEENPTTKQPDIESLWVENSSNLIYTVKFLDEEFALARALSPALYHLIRRIPLGKFADKFTEYTGNYDDIRASLGGDANILTIA